MNTASNNNTTEEVNKEECKTTPDQPVCSLKAHETAKQNEMTINIDSNSSKIKSEPEDSEIAETSRLKEQGTGETLQNVTEVVATPEKASVYPKEVTIKDDPDAEERHIIDYDMPLSKSPTKNNHSQQLTDMDDTHILSKANTTTSEAANQEQVKVLQANLAKVSNLMEGADKSALDALLDGLATPLASTLPRLKVKNEFSLNTFSTPHSETTKDNDNKAKDIDTFPPPPPPPFISTTDSLADGIATPHLSLAALNRLRVKPEFTLSTSYTEEHSDDSIQSPDDDFFKDLLPSEEIKKEAGEVSTSGSDDSNEKIDIPPDYFDSLTQEQLKERDEYLKRLRKLGKELDRREKHKKQKKSKKKSRKRSRSRSLSPTRYVKQKTHNEKNPQEFEGSYGEDTNPSERPSYSNYQRQKGLQNVPFSVDSSGVKVKSEFPVEEFKNNEATSMCVENIDKIEENLTPRQRRERAIKRAKAVLSHIQESSEDNSNVFSKFLFVSTVRKLPTSHSYVQQQIYENRSPLHTVNNVSYKFNSYTTRFNMEEWGLAALPTQAAKLARQIGCDAEFIHQKLKTLKIPAKLKKIKQETNQQSEDNEEEELVETSSSLYSNAMTQTEDTEEFETTRKSKGYEIGIQVEPEVFSIGSQTLETQSPTENMHKDDEAPIMQIIRDLNENQLMAIHSFAELIRLPNSNNSAMDMYKIQLQIMDIYKMSQIPSALVPQQTQSVNNYSTTTHTTSPSSRRQTEGGQQQSPIMHIKSVTGGDGTKFVMNDPRAKSIAYTKRIANDGTGSSSSSSSSNHDNRYSGFSQYPQERNATENIYNSNSRSTYDRFYNEDYKNNSSATHHSQYNANKPIQPTSTKRYGRGAARR